MSGPLSPTELRKNIFGAPFEVFRLTYLCVALLTLLLLPSLKKVLTLSFESHSLHVWLEP